MKSIPEDLALLQACGETLWGDNWRPALRAHFRINAVTTRRWLTGEAIVPRTLWVALSAHMHQHAATVAELAAAIDTRLDQE